MAERKGLVFIFIGIEFLFELSFLPKERRSHRYYWFDEIFLIKDLYISQRV